jgi:uncharacterized protein
MDLRTSLQAAVPAAMKARDKEAVSALRSALARIANAEAVPIDTMPAAGAIGEGPVGHGAADAPRRQLDESEIRALVMAEVTEHEQAADLLAASGQVAVADGLRAQAAVLRSHLG